MTDLEKYKRVNACETIEELQACIKGFADELGQIQGRTKKFSADNMAINADLYYNDFVGSIVPNVLTREFGIRQQAMYIKFYKHGSL